MTNPSAEALVLKSEGNAFFSKKNYAGAESCYSRASVQPPRTNAFPSQSTNELNNHVLTWTVSAPRLVLDPSLTSLYTNRAMCRFNLGNHDGVVSDCNACIAASPSSVKAHYFLSKSLAALGDYETASAEASAAYDVCLSTGEDKSLTMTHDWLLQCRTQRWRSAEKARVREHRDLEAEVLALLARDRDETVSEAGGGDVDKAIVWEESERKMGHIRDIFERARAVDDKAREVPGWLMDDITFDVMTDPVIVCPSLPPTPDQPQLLRQCC